MTTIDALIARLECSRYGIDNSDPVDVAYRRGFNDGITHALRELRGQRIAEGLKELRDAPAVDMRRQSSSPGGMAGVVEFDLSDGGEG